MSETKPGKRKKRKEMRSDRKQKQTGTISVFYTTTPPDYQ